MNLFLTGINEDQSTLKPSFINKNFPNPFENFTNFQIFVSEPSDVTFTLFDILGNMIFTKTEISSDGYHNFSLIADGLKPGNYYFRISNNQNPFLLKLIKIGNSIGITPYLEYKGSEKTITKNIEKNIKPAIQIVDTSLYSFTCYAKGHQAVKIDSVSISKMKSGDTLTFFLIPINKLKIQSGYIEVSGINCKYWYQSDWESRSGSKSKDTATKFIPYIFQNIIQNIYLPHDDDWYYPYNGSFLSCNSYNVGLILNFCNKSFIMSEYEFDSKSIIVELFFNKDTSIIDSIKFNIYYCNRYYGPSFGGLYTCQSDEKIYNNLYIYNLPYTMDSQNNLVVDIKGKDIINFLKIGYSENKSKGGNFGAGSGMGSENENFVSIDSVDDNAYIKLILSH